MEEMLSQPQPQGRKKPGKIVAKNQKMNPRAKPSDKEKVNKLLEKLKNTKPGKEHEAALNELKEVVKDLPEFKKLKEVLQKNKEEKDQRKNKNLDSEKKEQYRGRGI